MITYHLKESLPTAKQKRRDAQKKDPNNYPTPDQLRAEAEEEEPGILITILDAEGKTVRQFSAPSSAGLHRVPWDMRLASAVPSGPRSVEADDDSFGFSQGGSPAMPGKYSATISKRVNGVVAPLAGPIDFQLRYVGPSPLPPADLKLLVEFQKQMTKLHRDLAAVQGTSREITTKLNQMKVILDQLPEAPAESRERVRKLITNQREIARKLNGDSVLSARNENVPMSIAERVGVADDGTYLLTAKPTGTQREQFAIARKEVDDLSAALRKLTETDLKELETLLDKLGAPWTPGRLPAGK